MGNENKLTLEKLKEILKKRQEEKKTELKYHFGKRTIVGTPKPKPEPKPEPKPKPRLEPRPKPNLLESLLDDLTAGILQKPELRPQMGKIKDTIYQKQRLTKELTERFDLKMKLAPTPKVEIIQKPKLTPPGMGAMGG